MNRYNHQFSATCPSDGATIIYSLTIKTKAVIAVEDLIEACRFALPEFHESIADKLSASFGGKQRLVAMHQGVFITTKRSSLLNEDAA